MKCLFNNLKYIKMKKPIVLFITLFTCYCLIGQTIELPAPQKTGGMPLMEALAKRATARDFDTTSITMQQLSDLLWASFGVNRPDGRRTAPSANNKQEIEIYVLLKKGAYVYDAMNNKLILVLAEDLRSQAAAQRYAEAPVQLIYIADLSKRGDDIEEGKMRTANIDCGYISQNTYLYCTSAGLATGARGTVNRDALVPKLNLRPDQRILLAHSVGYPKP
jgi:SagB-type dehydrogenase family enzyme